MSELSKLVGERIRNIRKQKGLSQEELGNLCDLHPKYISTLERGEKNITLDSIEKVTNAFGINLEEFFSNLQPSLDNSNEVLIKIYNLLQSRNIDDQKAMLKNLEFLVEWKDT